MWVLGVFYLSALISFNHVEGRRHHRHHKHEKGGRDGARRSFVIERISQNTEPLLKTYASCKHEGKTRHHGEAWSPGPCVLECKCLHGHVRCAKLDCPDLNCDKPIKKKWKCCPECPTQMRKEKKCGIEAVGGNIHSGCCVFPFKYNDVNYYTCTYQDYNKPWCAVTRNYDKDRKWGLCVDKGELAKVISSKNRNSKLAHLKPKCQKDENCQNKEDILNNDNLDDLDVKELPLELAGKLDDNITAAQIANTSLKPVQVANTSLKPVQNVSNATTGQQQAHNITATGPNGQQPAQNASNPSAAAALQNATIVPRPTLAPINRTTPANVTQVFANITRPTPAPNVTATTMIPVYPTSTKRPLVGGANAVGQGGATVNGVTGGTSSEGKLINVTIQPYNRTANLSWPHKEIGIPINFLAKPVPIWNGHPHSGGVPPYLKPGAHNATKKPASTTNLASNVVVETTEIFQNDSRTYTNNVNHVTGKTRQPSASSLKLSANQVRQGNSNNQSTATNFPSTLAGNKSVSESLAKNQSSNNILPTNQSGSTSAPIGASGNPMISSNLTASSSNTTSNVSSTTLAATQEVTPAHPTYHFPQNESLNSTQTVTQGGRGTPNITQGGGNPSNATQEVAQGGGTPSNATQIVTQGGRTPNATQEVNQGGGGNPSNATQAVVQEVTQANTQAGGETPSNATQVGENSSNATQGVNQEVGKPSNATQAVTQGGGGNLSNATSAVIQGGGGNPFNASQEVTQGGVGNPINATQAVTQGGTPSNATQAITKVGGGNPTNATQVVTQRGGGNPSNATQAVTQGGRTFSNSTQAVTQGEGGTPTNATKMVTQGVLQNGNYSLTQANRTGTNSSHQSSSALLQPSASGNSTSRGGTSINSTNLTTPSQVSTSNTGKNSVQPAAPSNNQHVNDFQTGASTATQTKDNIISSTSGYNNPISSATSGYNNPISPATSGYNNPILSATSGYNNPISSATSAYDNPKNPTSLESSEEDQMRKIFANYHGPLTWSDLKALYGPGGYYSPNQEKYY